MNAATDVNVEDILDGVLDDIADLPEFKPLVAGAFKVSMSWDIKEVNSKRAVENAITVLEVIELENPTDTAPNVGDKTSILYFLDNEFGLGNMKKDLAPIRAAIMPEGTNREVIEAAQGIEALIITGNPKPDDKKNPSKWFTNLKQLEVL